MKHLYVVILTNFSLVCTMHAQIQSLQPYESSVKHDNSMRACLAVKMEATEDEIEDSWSDHLKNTYKIKLSGTGFLGMGKMEYAEQITIPQIAPEKIDLYTSIDKDNEGSIMKVFARFNSENYINIESHADAYENLEEMVQGYLDLYLPAYYQNQITQTREELEDVTKVIKRMERTHKKNSKDLEELKNEIEENQELMNNKQERQSRLKSILEKRQVTYKQINQRLRDQ